MLSLEPTLTNFDVRPGGGKDQKRLGKKGFPCFATPGGWKLKKHFMLECEALKDNMDKLVNILADNTWYNLFNKEHIKKLGALVIDLHRQRSTLQKLVQIGEVVP